MKRIFLALGVIAAGAVATAQEAGGSLGGYNALQIGHVGRFLGGFDASITIKEMTEGVNITLLSEDGSQPPLPMRAYTMKFTWIEGSGTPSVITMEGSVEVNHPMGSVTAEKAVWDFAKEELVFTGNPVMNSEKVQGLRGSKMTINFRNNTFEVDDMEADKVPLRGMGDAGSDPALLTSADVRNWSGLLDTLKAESKAEGATPGKQVVGQLDKDVQSALRDMPTETLAKQSDNLLKQLNKVLKKPGLYSEEAWKGISLGEEAKGLAAKGPLDAKEQTRFNRLLLQAAYPNFIVAR